MKIRTARLHEDPLKVLVTPSLETQGCLVVSGVSKEEYIAVVEFIKNAGFGFRLLPENEIAIFPAKNLVTKIENLEQRISLIEKVTPKDTK